MCLVTDFKFVDDTPALEEGSANAQPILRRIICEAKAVGLKINPSKTKLFTASPDLMHSFYVNR